MNEIIGIVKKDIYAKGSKSEREAYFIEFEDRRYLLRRKNGPAYGNDVILEQFLNLKIKCSGYILNDITILATEIEGI